ncbi:MAG: ABC transporter substrate-binding protein, partial [Actinomycetota bacterium]
LAALLIVASCSGDDDAAADVTAPATDSVSTDEPATTAPSAETTPTQPDATPATTAPPESPATTVAPTTAAPETTAPEADERTIIALDEQAALHLLSLGITPTTVLTTLSSEVFAALNGQLGIDTVEFIIAEPSFELLASLSPDLLVGIANPFLVQRADEYEAIAPLAVAPLDGTWQEQLRAIAGDVDAAERADAVIAAIEDVQFGANEILGDAGATGTSVSVMTVRLGNVLAVTSGGATGRVLTDAGLARPDAQAVEGSPGIPFVPVAEENLGDHDADLVLVASGGAFDLQPLLDSPIYAQLDAVERGDTYEVVGDAWVLGGTALATYWVLTDLVRLLVDDRPPATLDDAAEQWADFLTRIG